MRGYICGFDWLNVPPMKYWSFPAGYDKNKKQEEINAMILGGDYIGALKVDGFYQRILKDEDGNCFMISREKSVSGEATNKIEWIPQVTSWIDALPNGTCVLCECYIPGKEGSKNVTKVLGCTKNEAITRQKNNPCDELHLYVFDVMAFNGQNYNNATICERVYLFELLPHQNNYVDYATYFSGDSLAELLQKSLGAGREGIVISKKDAIVYQKRTPARVTVKVKREIKNTIDCVVIGINLPEEIYAGGHLETWKYFCNSITGENLPEGFHDEPNAVPVTRLHYKKLPGSFQLGLYKNGELIHFGDLSGLSDDVLDNWIQYYKKVCEVGGMDIDNKSGHIRHPKLIRWRDDKPVEDCTWGQVKLDDEN